MQESVDIAANWTEENYMKLNKEKSKEIIVTCTKNKLLFSEYHT